MTTELFLVWFKKFVAFSKASKDFPVLLILDGHSTHTKNLDVIDYARDNGVSLLCLPPHCSHRIQPLDVSFMKPLSLHYSDELRMWLRSNPGKVVTLFQISMLFGSAFIQSASMLTAIKGFEKPGIWPPSPSVFTDSDFLPADTTDIDQAGPVTQNANGTSSEKGQAEESSSGLPADADNSLNLSDKGEDTSVSPGLPVDADNAVILSDKGEDASLSRSTGDVNGPPAKKVRFSGNDKATPGCSWMTTDMNDSATTFTVSPEVLIPIPKVRGSAKRSNRRRGKTAILTDSPYKNELEAAIKAKEEKERAKVERARMRLFNKENKQKKTVKTKGKSLKKSEKITLKKQTETSDSDSDECSDCECLYCCQFYSKSIEGWIACSMCNKWAHNSCAGIDSEEDEAIFICEFCQSDSD